MKISELKETVRTVIIERSINAIAKLQQKNIEDISKALEFYKKNKHTDKKEAFIKVLKKLGNEKLKLAGELDLKVSGMYKDAEYKGEGIEEGENGLWDNIRKKKARGGKPAHKNSKAHKDAVKAGDKIKANESVVNERYSDFIKAKNLTDIIKLSKQKKNATFYVTDDNNSRIGTFYLKNGKFAKATTANANYDLQNSKTSLKNRNDVIYKYKVDESVNEGKYNYKADALTAYFKGKIDAKELDKIARDDFKSGIATKKELSNFLSNKFTQDVMSDTYGIPAGTLVKRVRGLMKFAEGIGESVVNEATPFHVLFKVKKDISNRSIKPATASYKSESDAKKFLKSVKKDGGKGMIVRRNENSTEDGVPQGYNPMVEDKSEIKGLLKKVGNKETKFYDVLSAMEKKYGKSKYRTWLEKSLKDFGVNSKHYDYRTNGAAEEKLFQLGKK